VIEHFAGSGPRAVGKHPQLGELTEREREAAGSLVTANRSAFENRQVLKARLRA